MLQEAKRVCSQCGEIFPSRQTLCPQDKQELFVIEGSDDPNVGRRIKGMYTLLGLLGHGGVGIVYRALQHSMDREVALKLISPDRSDDKMVGQRFQREAKSASRLAHSNIITLFDFGQTRKRELFIVMELLEGWTLREKLLAEKQFELSEASNVIDQVCKATHFAHSKKVIHRDLKPENIFLIPRANDDDDLVKVIDFGIAKIKSGDQNSAISQKGLVFGTPAYMSPEQIRGKEIDGRSDIYTISCVFFEMLTGRVPFEEKTPLDVVAAHLQKPAPPLTEFWPDAPPQLVQLLSEALEKHPARRPQTAAIFAERIASILKGDKVAQSLEEPSGSWISRTLHPLETPRKLRSPFAEDLELEPNDSELTNFFGENLGFEDPSSFVGRQADLAELHRLLEFGRPVITIHGPAGMGKTRLVREFLARSTRASESFTRGGVCFVDLTEARTCTDITLSVSRALGTPFNLEEGLGKAIEHLGNVIASKGRMLLVLDNFEQITTHARATIGRWTFLAPVASFIVTSREILGIRVEKVYGLEPLSVPRSIEEVEGSEAVQLFVERARGIRSDFTIDSAESGRVVSEIVRRLDGIPLAIELAAARMAVLGPRQLLQRLDDRFSLLAGRRRDSIGRQATLWAALEWSWELLTPLEQRAMALVSIFRGGFDIPAAEAVISVKEQGDGSTALDLVQSLVDKALLRTYEVPIIVGELRFILYESIRQFARKKLDKMGLTIFAIEGHEKHYLETCRKWSEDVLTRGGLESRHRLNLEAENLSALFERSLAVHPPTLRSSEAAMAALSMLNPIMAAQGVVGESLTLAEDVLKHSKGIKVSAGLLAGAYYCRAEARRARGMLAEGVGDYRLALRLAQSVGDQSREAWCLGQLGIASLHQGRIDDGIASITRALETYRTLGEPLGLGWQLGMLGSCLYACGDLGRALECCQEAVSILEELEDPGFQGCFQVTLGKILQEQGHFEEARGEYQEALVKLRQTEVRLFETIDLGCLGGLSWEQGLTGQALSYLQQAVEMAHVMGHALLEGFLSGCLAAVRADLDQIDESFSGFKLSRSLLRPEASMTYATTANVYRGHLDLALARHEREQGNIIAATVHTQAARERGELARYTMPPDPVHPMGMPNMSRCSDEVRFALRMLDKAIKASGN